MVVVGVDVDSDSMLLLDPLGIGLTLVKRIVELHGGNVTASSPGLSQGSEFAVRLPLCLTEVHGAKPGPLRGQRDSAHSGRRILVVNDNVDAPLSVERLLKIWGHEVATAFRSADAIEKARSFRPQIVRTGLPS